MFSLLSRKITDFLCTEEVIEKEDWEFYDYGFQLLISSVFGFLMILLLGLIRGQFWEAAFFLSALSVFGNEAAVIMPILIWAAMERFL